MTNRHEQYEPKILGCVHSVTYAHSTIANCIKSVSVLYVVTYRFPLIIVEEVTHPVQKSASGFTTYHSRYQQLRESGYMTVITIN